MRFVNIVMEGMLVFYVLPVSCSFVISSCCCRSLQEGGLLLTAPEHRLSLQLKRLELGAQAGKEDVCRLLDDFAKLPYVDTVDEVDELLHHR